ncbi:hypothetical protein CAL7716_102210 (plasmid) [Calothrix sp. PCC 7716]|nr:hypothetical protein CAL7716_102210 [Calothrix sp. PCC 7716]
MSIQLKNLIEGLSEIPPHWLIVPARMKMALGKSWQSQPYLANQLQELLIRQNGILRIETKHGLRDAVPTGFGLKCGANNKEFLLAIDCDGIEAYRRVIEINEGKQKILTKVDDLEVKQLAERYLPPTVSFTSGRKNRRQYIYKTDLSMQHQLKSRVIDAGNGSHLELRGTNLNSILPPSLHPRGKQYKWVLGSPRIIPVEEAPQWVINLMNYKPRKHTKSQSTYQYSQIDDTHEGTPEEIKIASTLLDVIHPRYADDYIPWIKIGMALKSVSDKLLPDWEEWSQLSDKYEFGLCPYKWSTFKNLRCSIRSLYYFANNS